MGTTRTSGCGSDTTRRTEERINGRDGCRVGPCGLGQRGSILVWPSVAVGGAGPLEGGGALGLPVTGDGPRAPDRPGISPAGRERSQKNSGDIPASSIRIYYSQEYG